MERIESIGTKLAASKHQGMIYSRFVTILLLYEFWNMPENVSV